jgi:Spy/CpxP family protein refolding chaperone
MRALGFAFFMLSCVCASLASAFPGGEPPPGFEPRPEAVIARHAQELGIDAATLEQIRALGEQHRAEREVIAGELQKQKLALRALLESERPNEAEAISLARKIGTLETDLSVARLSAMMRIHGLLTPEQNKALRERMRSHFIDRRVLLDGATQACAAELAEHCEDADESGPPGAPPLMCLLHKRHIEQLALGAECEAALREIPPPHFFRFHGPGPVGPGAPGELFNVPVPPPPGMEAEEAE